MAKNAAFEMGKQAAEKYKQQCIAVSQDYWQEKARAFAHGHLSTSAAQSKFVEGWMSIEPPLLVSGERITLLVRIMNHSNPQALEREMKDLFLPYQHTKIEFLEESKICLKYRMETGLVTLNRGSSFFKQRQVSYDLWKETA